MSNGGYSYSSEKEPPVQPANSILPSGYGPRVKLLTELPVIYMSPLAYGKLNAIVELVTKSVVGMLGSVEVVGGDIYVKDLFLFPQTRKYQSASVSDVDISSFMKQLPSGTTPDMLKMLVTIHSDHSLAPTKDDLEMLAIFTDETGPLFIHSIVSRVTNAMSSTIYLYDAGVKIEDVSWFIDVQTPPSVTAMMSKTFDENVKDYSTYHAESGVSSIPAKTATAEATSSKDTKHAADKPKENKSVVKWDFKTNPEDFVFLGQSYMNMDLLIWQIASEPSEELEILMEDLFEWPIPPELKIGDEATNAAVAKYAWKSILEYKGSLAYNT
jgi:hypothetical protein